MKILIVDDELLVRIGVKTILEGLGLRLEIRTAEDGLEALEVFSAFLPDLVFADINMPKMNGLDFIRLAKQKQPSSRFVVLTCYNDIESVRTSMKLGASDYVIKTELNRDEIARLVWECTGEDASPLPVAAAPERSAFPAVDYPKLDVVLPQLQREFEGQPVSVLYAQRKRPRPSRQESAHTVVSGLLEGILSDYGKGRLFHQPDGAKFIVLSFCPRRDDPAVEEMLTVELCQQIANSMRTYFNEDYAIGCVLCGNAASLPQGLARAQRSSRLCFYDAREDVFLCSGQQNTLRPDAAKAVWSSMKRALENREYQTACSLFQQFVEQLSADKPGNIDNVIQKLFDLFYLVLQHIQQNYSQLSQSLLKDMDYRTFFLEHNDLESYCAKIGNMLSSILEVSGCKAANTGSRGLVEQAKAYIAEHLEDTLDLQNVSSYVNLSPSHFTRLFKEIEGVTFIDYCIERRIERAKVYINEGDKIFIAAEKVGYQNYSYFSKLFKRLTGLTPEDYRKQRKG